MENQKEDAGGKGKMATFIRWIFLTTTGLLLFVTIIMAIYRKFEG